MNCHGPFSIGLPPSFPYLAGQYASYMQLQFALWKQGKRKNDPLNVMKDIAMRLNDENIRAVSLYFESVHPQQGEEKGEEHGGTAGHKEHGETAKHGESEEHGEHESHEHGGH